MSFSNRHVGQSTECGKNSAGLELVTRSCIEKGQNVQWVWHVDRGLIPEDRIIQCPSRHPLYWS